MTVGSTTTCCYYSIGPQRPQATAGKKSMTTEEEFRVCPHDLQPGKKMVEYWRDGKFVAGIYPHQDGIRIVSKYMTGVVTDPSYPPAAIIKLEGC